jgi:hypothetical protein
LYTFRLWIGAAGRLPSAAAVDRLMAVTLTGCGPKIEAVDGATARDYDTPLEYKEPDDYSPSSITVTG